MKKTLILLIGLISTISINAQDVVTEFFSGTRVLSNHSNEMLPKNTLEFIVAHKFGDLAGTGGGLSSFYGLDNLEDVRIAFEYGLFDKIDIGLGRSKGILTMTQVLDGYFKYSILQQKTSGMPVSLTFVSSMAMPYRNASTDSTNAAYYPKWAHRFIFTNQLFVTRKFGDRFILQANLGYNHRNFVADIDKNEISFAGLSGRIRFTKHIGLLFEYNHIFYRPETVAHYNPLSFGIEFLTGGHAFILGFSNSTAINENLFIPGTTSDWTRGQFRFGFQINRRFKL